MPPNPDWGGLIAAFGPTGAAIIALVWILSKSDFLKRDPPRSNDAALMAELRAIREDTLAMHKSNEAEFRGLRDRMTRVEVVLEERRQK